MALEKGAEDYWTDRVRNEGMLREEYPTNNKKRESLTGLVTSCIGTAC